MSFNPEVSFKALEKRVAGMESAADKLEVQLRAGDFKSIDARLTKLETLVKTLVETRADSKLDALNKSILALQTAGLAEDQKIRDLMLVQNEKRRQESEKQAKAVSEEAKAYAEKMMAQIKVETRLNVLEAKIAPLLATMGR